MSKLTIILLVILVVLVVALVVLYFVGKKAQRRQIAQKEQMDAVAQTVSMLIIDKKKLRLSQSGLPEQVIEQTPKLLNRKQFKYLRVAGKGHDPGTNLGFDDGHLVPAKKLRGLLNHLLRQA